MFGRPDDNGRWLRLREVRFEEGKTFGWRIRLPCRQAVEFLEVRSEREVMAYAATRV